MTQRLQPSMMMMMMGVRKFKGLQQQRIMLMTQINNGVKVNLPASSMSILSKSQPQQLLLMTQRRMASTTPTTENKLSISKNSNPWTKMSSYRFFSDSSVRLTTGTGTGSTPTKVESMSSAELDRLVKKEGQVVVFMKGVPDEPRCGFSNAVVQILRMHGVTSYDAHDVLENESLRQGIKEYSNWPTIPQVYINGEFIGGCDILIELHKSGELIEQLKKIGIKSALEQDSNSSTSDQSNSKKE